MRELLYRINMLGNFFEVVSLQFEYHDRRNEYDGSSGGHMTPEQFKLRPLKKPLVEENVCIQDDFYGHGAPFRISAVVRKMRRPRLAMRLLNYTQVKLETSTEAGQP
jgi:hypothetical protein